MYSTHTDKDRDGRFEQSKDQGSAEGIADRIGLGADRSNKSAADDKGKRAGSYDDGSSFKSQHGGKATQLFYPGPFCLTAGVILPCLLLSSETTFHLLARTQFDPFPTFAHILLFSLIPFSNFLGWLSVRLNIRNMYAIAALSNGTALGIAILYTLMLMPIFPLFLRRDLLGSMMGMIAPLSILATIMTGKTICQLADRERAFFDAHQLKHLGHLIVLVMVVSIELPSTLTRINLSDAATSAKQNEAISWLRSWGNREVLLRACYERSGRATDIVGSLYEHQHPVPIETARRIYYQVTGLPFNSIPIPASFRSTIQHAGLIDDPHGLNADVTDEFDLDPDIAGEVISGAARGLSASESSIAVEVDSTAALANIDWDFTFQNVSSTSREARAKILLPPDAVVTDATIWLNDYKKDATIMGRSRARATYQRAVREHKKDPLLVSMTGKDTVLVQCYPVADGIRTKIRLHIVSPMELTPKAGVALSLPVFIERNFDLRSDHKLTVHGDTGVSVQALVTDKEARSADGTVIGRIDNSTMARFATVVESKRKTVVPVVYCENRFDPDFGTTIIKLEDRTYKRPERLEIVIDGSVSMEPYMQQVESALSALPKDVPVTITLCLDGEQEIATMTNSSTKHFQSAMERLSKVQCSGGQCNEAGLWNAIQRASKKEGTAVLWIHAAQPLTIQKTGARNIDSLLSSKNTSPSPGFKPQLYDLQVASGPNELLNDSLYFPTLNRVPRIGTVGDDLKRFFSRWSSKEGPLPDGRNDLETVQKLSPEKNLQSILRSSNTLSEDKNAMKAASSLSQLVAYKEVLELASNNSDKLAAGLALTYHIVSPVSSAVVTDDIPIPVPVPAQKKENETLNEPQRIFKDALKNSTVAVLKKTSPQASVAGLGGSAGQKGDMPASPPSEMKEQKQTQRVMAKAQMFASGSGEPADVEGAESLSRARNLASDSRQEEAMPARRMAEKVSDKGVNGNLLTDEMSQVAFAPSADGAAQQDELSTPMKEFIHPTPEPDTLPMVLIAILSVAAAMFFLSKRTTVAEE